MAFEERHGLEGIPDDQITLMAGMSLFNSHFNQENIHRILQWAKGRFHDIMIMCPVLPYENTLRAQGFLGDIEMAKKIRLQFNALRNKVRKASQALGFEISDDRFITFHEWWSENPFVPVLDGQGWEYFDRPEFFAHSAFDPLANVFCQDYVRDVQIEARQFVDNKRVSEDRKDAAERECFSFLWAEYCLIRQAAMLLRKDYVAYLYHRPLPALARGFSGGYTDKRGRILPGFSTHHNGVTNNGIIVKDF